MMESNRFTDIVRYAYRYVPMYMRREAAYEKIEKWEDIPILRKEELQKNPDSSYSCEFMNAVRREDIAKMHTSGSTGKCLEFYWHKDDYARSLLPVWILRRKFYGISTNDKMCYFYTTPNGYNEINESGLRERRRYTLGFSKSNLTHERLLKIYRDITEFEPAWLFIQPSMAVLLCDIAEETGNGIPGLKYIELTGEMLTEHVRQRIKKVFGCYVANHYGSHEVNTIALECPEGHMHIVDNNILVEVIDEDTKELLPEGEEGRLLITSAVNRVSPFIRYDIGDRGRVFGKSAEDKCSCGCNMPVLELTKGRVHEYIETENGEKINAYIFVHAVEKINNAYESCIKQYKIIQTDYDRFKVKLVVDDEIEELGIDKRDIEELFRQSITHPGMEESKYEFEYFERILQDDGKGKMLWYEKNNCELKETNE